MRRTPSGAVIGPVEPQAVGPPSPVRKKDLASGAFLLGALGFCTGGVMTVAGLLVGVLAVVRSVRDPAAQGRGRAIGAVALNLGILGIAALSIPSLLRAKPSALESATIDDLRSMISAQAAYSRQNDGLFEARLECLAEPATCLPGYPKNGPRFLDLALASLETKAGYRRAFYPGPPGGPRPALRGRPRPPGVRSFAYTAVPVAYEGMRAFCGDATGLICFTRDGREPRVTAEGKCDLSTCQVYR
jgi:hypothetical protein